MAGTKTLNDANRAVFIEWNRSPDSVPADIPDKDRLAFYDDVAEYINLHQTEFDEAAIKYSRQRLGSELYGVPVADTSFDWQMFGQEYVKEVKTQIGNPLGGWLSKILFFAVFVFIVVYFFPRIMAGIRGGK